MNVNRGFTLIEVLVTTVLVAVAVTGVLGGIRAIGVTEARAHSADLLQRLAAEKMNDLRLLPDPSEAPSAGDFSDRGSAEVTWKLEVEATDTTTVDQVTVTASRGLDSQSLTTLMFVPPTTGTAGGASTGASSP